MHFVRWCFKIDHFNSNEGVCVKELEVWTPHLVPNTSFSSQTEKTILPDIASWLRKTIFLLSSFSPLSCSLSSVSLSSISIKTKKQRTEEAKDITWIYPEAYLHFEAIGSILRITSFWNHFTYDTLKNE